MKTPIKIGLAIVVFLVLAVVGGVVFLMVSDPKKKDFADLEEPRIVEKGDVKILQVDFDGDPDVVIKDAYSKLFKVYYGLKGVPKFVGQPASLARYEGFDTLLDNVSEEKLKETVWKGFVAIPVPDPITTLSDDAKAAPYPVRLETLQYGIVAEIVHYGPYEDETPTIRKLKEYIADQGYEIAGLHEEAYFKGPGLPFIRPKDYITVIRYQVKKK